MYAVKREGEGEGEESSWPYPRRRRAREDEALTKQLLISLHKDEAEKRMLMLTLKRANITRPVVDPRAVSQLFFFFLRAANHETCNPPPVYCFFCGFVVCRFRLFEGMCHFSFRGGCFSLIPVRLIHYLWYCTMGWLWVWCGGWGEAGITDLYTSGLSGFSNRYIFKLSLSCE